MLRNLITAVGLLLFASASRADLQQEMEKMFGSMVNVTDPTAVHGARFGAFTGGSAYVRVPIVTPRIIQFSPPSINGMGCGGIDLFGGSFSFINADEFVAYMRTIAQNAAGYFFNVALQSMCPTCYSIMEDLRSISQDLNKFSANSCRAATAIVDSLTPQSWKEKQEAAEEGPLSAIAAATGTIDDIFQWRLNPGKPPSKSIDEEQPQRLWEEGGYGNIVWLIMTRSGKLETGIDDWYEYGDLNLMRALLSLTGTVVIRPKAECPEEEKNARGTCHTEPVPYKPTITLRTLVEGAPASRQAKLFNCETLDAGQMVSNPEAYGCLLRGENPYIDTTLVGFAEKITELLGGNDFDPSDPNYSAGIIQKLVSNTEDFTAREVAFMDTIPDATVIMIRQMVLNNPGQARHFARQIAPALAADIAFQFINETIQAVRLAVQEHRFHHSTSAITFLNDAEDDATAARQEYLDQLARVQHVATIYNQYRSLNLVQYTPGTNPFAVLRKSDGGSPSTTAVP